ncbi:MAG: ArnT family glycosyltransferase [Bacteroidota bacterium]
MSLLKDYRVYAAGLIFLYILLSMNIGRVPIYILDESKNAGCAREMLERGDFVVPTFNYELRTDKPVLHYYFMMAGYKLFGVNSFGARIFSVFFGALTLLITFVFTRKFFDHKTALLSLVILIASLHFVLQFHLAVPDPYLIFFMNATFFSFFVYWKDRKSLFLYLVYVSAALGTLAKGPVAVAIPGLVFLLFLLFSKSFNWKTIRNLKLLRGILIYSIIALPWYILVHLQTNGQWTEGFFLKHNVERFTSTMHGHGGSFYFPLLYLIVGMLPFVVFAVSMFRKTWKERKDPVKLFLLLIILTMVGFFAISQTQLPNYIVPMYPAFAILLAYYLKNVSEMGIFKKQLIIPLSIYLVLMLALPLAVYFGLHAEAQLSHLASFWIFFLALPIGAGIAIYYAVQKRVKSVIFSLASSWIITSFLFFSFVFPAINKENPVMKAQNLIDKEASFAHFRRYNPAFSFYLQKEIPPADTNKEIIQFFDDHPDGFLITTRSNYQRYPEEFENIDLDVILEQKDLFERPTTLILVQK